MEEGRPDLSRTNENAILKPCIDVSPLQDMGFFSGGSTVVQYPSQDRPPSIMSVNVWPLWRGRLPRTIILSMLCWCPDLKFRASRDWVLVLLQQHNRRVLCRESRKPPLKRCPVFVFLSRLPAVSKFLPGGVCSRWLRSRPTHPWESYRTNPAGCVRSRHLLLRRAVPSDAWP